MNSVILRFKVAKSKKVFEVIFDTRLSFIDNFSLFKSIENLDIKDKVIYDEGKNIALRRDVPISNFHFYNFITLSIY